MTDWQLLGAGGTCVTDTMTRASARTLLEASQTNRSIGVTELILIAGVVA